LVASLLPSQWQAAAVVVVLALSAAQRECLLLRICCHICSPHCTPLAYTQRDAYCSWIPAGAQLVQLPPPPPTHTSTHSHAAFVTSCRLAGMFVSLFAALHPPERGKMAAVASLVLLLVLTVHGVCVCVAAAKCQGAASYSTSVRARKTQAHASDKHETTLFAWLSVGSGRPLHHVHTGKALACAGPWTASLHAQPHMHTVQVHHAVQLEPAVRFSKNVSCASGAHARHHSVPMCARQQHGMASFRHA
jgi:hypothetical protein